MTNEKTPAERVRAHFEAGAKRQKAAKVTTTETKATKSKAEEPKEP